MRHDRNNGILRALYKILYSWVLGPVRVHASVPNPPPQHVAVFHTFKVLFVDAFRKGNLGVDFRTLDS